MECLTPPLNAVPVDEWFCPECSEANHPEEVVNHVSEEEVSSLLADVVPTTSRLRNIALRTRAIARTRQSERVRATVNRNRISTAHNIQHVPRYLMSSLLDESIEAVVAGLNTAIYQRPLTSRAITGRKKRKVGRKRTIQSKGSKGTRGVTKKRRRKFKRRKGRRLKAKKMPTSHSRIARSLGICSPPRGSALPRIQRAPEQTLGTLRQDIGAATLSVFGNAYDLDPFDCNEEHMSNPTSPLTSKRRVLSRSAMRSHQPVARPISVGLARGSVAPLAHDSLPVSEPVPDLLGSILSGQSMLMMKSSDITISRDGSLTAKKSGNSLPCEKPKTDVLVEPSTSHSEIPMSSSSEIKWKPFEEQPQHRFPSSDLYSLSPASSPPLSSSSLERVPVTPSSLVGTSSFRLKNAFTPRVVQVQASAGRVASKSGEPFRFNGIMHKPESLNSNDNKGPSMKYPVKSPAMRLEISELPRIPKIKKETNSSSSNITNKQIDFANSPNRNIRLPSACVNQLTGRGDSHQLGKFNTTESRTKNSQQESNDQSRYNAGVYSGYTSAGSNTASVSSSSSRNVGSQDVGGFRITISGSSGSSCRQFSPSSKDPFRATESKTQSKCTLPYPPASTKKEKPLKNEIYDPFEPTGSDSGSRGSSPERPGPSSLPSAETIKEATNSTISSGAKVGTFRSFRLLPSHSNKVSASKLGPGFSDLSPSSKEHREHKNDDLSSVLTPFIKVEKEIKNENLKQEQTPFKISCPLSGLKITSDLKPGGTRGFHFDVKSEADPLPNRVIHQSSNSRFVWETESPSQTKTSSSNRGFEVQRKITIKKERKSFSRSLSRSRSPNRDSRSVSWSSEEEKEKKSKSKSHKSKRAHSDRSSSGSCERSRKKRQKEKKKEKKRKVAESKEKRRSRSTSRSSSSQKTYSSKKKKKKKRGSRSGSAGHSFSPERDKKRKHKAEKGYSNKGEPKVKERRKSKEDRGKHRSRSPHTIKEQKIQRTKEKSSPSIEQELSDESLHLPEVEEKAVTSKVSLTTEYHSGKEEGRKSTLILPKEASERVSVNSLETEETISSEKDIELSNDDDDYDSLPHNSNSPPWSPSLLDCIFPENKGEDVEEFHYSEDIHPSNDIIPKVEVASPQASSPSTDIELSSPKPQSPPKKDEKVIFPAAKDDDNDLQWSPSHLDDYLLNEFSDGVCSVGATSPNDVDLEEAILMKRNDDYEEKPLVSFHQKQAIPFLQDEDDDESINIASEEFGNHIDDTTSKDNSISYESKCSSLPKTELEEDSLPKSKVLIKRVTWNLQNKSMNNVQILTDIPVLTRQNVKEEPQAASSKLSIPSFPKPGVPASPKQNISLSPQQSVRISPKQNNNLLTRLAKDSLSQITSQLPCISSDAPVEDSVPQVTIHAPWNAVDRPVKESKQVPRIASETPIQIFPQTLPPLPLPPVFPPYAPVSEPTVPSVLQSSKTIFSQTPKPGSLATANEPKIQAANTGDEKGKSKALKKGEKVKNDEYMKKLHIQERAVEEVKLAIKPFYQKREITKEEYKEILRKAVQKICHSKSGEINPVKVVNLVKAYVDKYKHARKHKKSEAYEDHHGMQDSPI
ncbi:hypothetical protein GDO86_008654 [Hymenochirus boettgeri]|uniref:SFR19-like C-terminal domain-containing protein n=1 Tax=Hymenochirus boettgeri TaxID=247094 RepID=A0A8T2J6M6_9PIPI|nr:hypothetical protein GDO86_008654 [Hymenochirus boettgeri]